MGKEELEELEKTFEDKKAILDRLGKKETTDQDVWNFKNLIECNLTKKLIGDFVKKLEDLPYRIYEIELNSGTKVMKLQVLYSDWFNLLKEYKEMLK